MARVIKRWAGVRRSVAIFSAGIGFIFCPPGVWATTDVSGGITVHGVGRAKARASVVELEVVVSGQGELAADANVKYVDAKKKGMDALNGLGIADLTVESDGPVISQASDPMMQQRIMNGQPSDAGKPKVEISESLRLIIKNADKLPPDKLIDTVLKIVDACRDAGLQIGAAPATNIIQMQLRAQMGGNGTGDGLANFKIPDKAEIEKEAYQKAVEDAKTKAKRLADLAGVKLGGVISVEDQAATGAEGKTSSMIEAIYGGGNGNAESDDDGLSSNAAGDIPLSVHLTVTFEIAK